MLTLAIPTFNVARFLPATLESLQAQRECVRWWLQDGASTDDTVAIARRFAGPEDRVVSERDRGQTDALNRAMPRMGGEIIGFINGDDELVPGAAAAVLAYFAAHPEVDLLYGEVDWIDSEGTVSGHHAGRIGSVAEVLDIYRVWWGARQWVQPEVFYRRALWERVGGFDPQYHLAFDYEFWVRCFLAGARVARLPQTLARFRVHAGQKSAAARQAADEIRQIVRRHLPAAALPSWQRRSLQARLAYDEYQGGDQAVRRPLWAELVRHPEWLLSPELRARLLAACSARLSRAEGAVRNS